MVREGRIGLPARTRRTAQHRQAPSRSSRRLTKLCVAVAPRALFRPLPPRRRPHLRELISEHQIESGKWFEKLNARCSAEAEGSSPRDDQVRNP
jgi:hypothetical protein